MNFCTLTSICPCLHKQASMHCTSTQYKVIRLRLSEPSVAMLTANGHVNDLMMKKTVGVTN